MGSMFRSEEMALCQLFIQPEAAYNSVSELGECGCAQFRDLNTDVNAFQRKFVNQVRRCDELERKLRYIEAELRRDNVAVPESLAEAPKAPNARETIELENILEKTENEVLELSQNAVNLKSNYLELCELKHVLEKAAAFFTEQEGVNGTDSLTQALINEDVGSQSVTIRGRLGFVAGVVTRERVPAFERMLWRISRGNVFLRQTDLQEPLRDPSTGNDIHKTVFVAFFQGEQLKSRVKKVCVGFHASLYHCPSVYSERQEILAGVQTRIEDLNLEGSEPDPRPQAPRAAERGLAAPHVDGDGAQDEGRLPHAQHVQHGRHQEVPHRRVLGAHPGPGQRPEGPRRRRANQRQFHSLLPERDRDAGEPAHVQPHQQVHPRLPDPHRLVRGRELSGGLYTVITFPFLFAVMFGDVGHGIIMTAFGAFMVLQEKKFAKKKLSEIWTIIFGGRYIILLMGLFSMYTGMIYNDMFSKSLNLFGSSWKASYNYSTVMENGELTLNPSDTKIYTSAPYPFGLDPVWQVATNKIIFLNSYKMKLSIIFGVIHMVFGISLSVINHLHFQRTMKIFMEFLPQILFLLLLFAYMVVMMFIKWVLYDPTGSTKYSPGCAPSVLILFINMMLFKSTPPQEGCDEFMFEGQGQLQMALVLVALLCIPVMLFGAPLLHLVSSRRSAVYASGNGDVSPDVELQQLPTEPAGPAAGAPDDHGAELSELLIYQGIHTVEYVLSTVSHTASYLRLWALSLAHAQLSEVLWSMVLHMGLSWDSYVGGVVLFVAFGAWAMFTIAILVLMEGLSAFLHTLRLHWVEFMSKFYVGLGYPFQPFSFKSILETTEEPTEEE
ncbi:V-type proton ATPase 116 kDa subunit a 1-like isoform X2 [Bacillus rossius redtenbacheri]|uniref:V-type proton ATPase 116 kDa subunit a 1-like isoform X2 n=1 Tax=Bacillus rossius redtenbacheri TaxID=93214 RepID=UPI002FDCEB1F